MGFSSFVGWIDFLHGGECDGSVYVAMVDLFSEWSGLLQFCRWIDFLHGSECDGSVSVAMVDLFSEWSIPLIPVWDADVKRVEACKRQ